jgi:integrase
MKGYIRPRGKDRWQVVLDVGKDPDGKRRQLWRTVCGKKKTAHSALAALIREVETGTTVDSARISLSEYLETWLASIRTRVAPSTWERYRIAVRHNILPTLGNVYLRNLRPMHIQKLYGGLLEGRGCSHGRPLSARTVHHVHVILGGALREAERLQLLARNPVVHVKPPRPADREMIALNEHQAVALLNAAKNKRLYIPILLALTCGLRRGEILGLQWQDVDVDSGRLSVRRVLTRAANKIYFKEPKTRKSNRTVAMSSLTCNALRLHRGSQAADHEALGTKPHDHDLLCPGVDGSPWHPAAFADAWERFASKVKDLPRIRFHDLRHTHATLLLRANFPAKVVSERLGHATAAITLDVYSHVLPGMQEEAAAKIDRALRPAFIDTVKNKSIA